MGGSGMGLPLISAHTLNVHIFGVHIWSFVMGNMFGKPKMSTPAPIEKKTDEAGHEEEERKRRRLAGRYGRTGTLLSQKPAPTQPGNMGKERLGQ